MRGREAGMVDPFVIGFVTALLITAISGHTALTYAELKTGPDDQRELYALIVCFVAGCASQLFFLMSRVGIDKPYRWQRWFGEVALGGVTAYAGSVAYLRYGPDVALTTLIVVAAVTGFIGQRLLVLLGEAVLEVLLKRFGITAKLGGTKPDGEKNAP